VSYKTASIFAKNKTMFVDSDSDLSASHFFPCSCKGNC